MVKMSFSFLLGLSVASFFLLVLLGAGPVDPRPHELRSLQTIQEKKQEVVFGSLSFFFAFIFFPLNVPLLHLYHRLLFIIYCSIFLSFFWGKGVGTGCSYTVKIKTSCSSSRFTRDMISLAFGDAYRNEVFVRFHLLLIILVNYLMALFFLGPLLPRLPRSRRDRCPFGTKSRESKEGFNERGNY